MDLPNLAALTRSVIHREIQVTYMRTSVENKYLVETVTAFSLEGPLEASNVVYIDIKRAFAGDGKKICLLITELLPRIDASDLTKSKTLHN